MTKNQDVKAGAEPQVQQQQPSSTMYQQQQVQRRVDTRYGEPISSRFTRSGGVIVLVYQEDGRAEEEAFSNVADYTAWLHQQYGAPRSFGGGECERSPTPKAAGANDYGGILNFGSFVKGRS